MFGASLASFAIRSSLVETIVELDVSVIFPSNGSVIRHRPLLDGVPRVGSPASSLVLRCSDFPAPDALSILHEVAGSSLRDTDRIAAAALRTAARRKKKIVERDVLTRILQSESEDPS